MIPFERAWPYETIGDDVYFTECPFCHARQVLLPLRKNELTAIREGRKRLLVLPCCRNRFTLVDADADYLLADRPLLRRRKG